MKKGQYNTKCIKLIDTTNILELKIMMINGLPTSLCLSPTCCPFTLETVNVWPTISNVHIPNTLKFKAMIFWAQF